MLALLATALLSLPVPLQDAPAAEGKHFRVLCHGFDSPDVAAEALEVVEALWPLAVQLYGLPEEALEERLVVHLYRRQEDYQRANRKIAQGEFERNLAFAHFDTRSAHVALQPACSDGVLAEFGVPHQTLRLLVHEAAHLARYEGVANFRSHPEWVVHGAASWIDQRVMEEVGRSSPLGDPWASKTVLRVQKLIAEERLPSAAAVFKGEFADLEFYDRYSLTEVFFRFLQQNEDVPMNRMLEELRRLGGGDDFKERYYERVALLLGKNWEEELDASFAKYLGELEPQWDQVLRSLEPRAEGYLQIAFPDTNAVAFRTAAGDGERFTMSGRLRMLPARKGQMNLLLGREEKGFVSVAIVSGYGLTVFDYDGALWKRIGDKKVAGVAVGEELSFEVRVENDVLELAINGKAVLQIDASELGLSGKWGLGAQAGSAGLWLGVT